MQKSIVDIVKLYAPLLSVNWNLKNLSSLSIYSKLDALNKKVVQ